MSNIDWQAARTKYITSGCTLEEISQDFGCDPSTVRLHSAMDRWVDAREEAQQKANKITTEKAAEDFAEINLRHAEYGQYLQHQALASLLDKERPVAPKTFSEALSALRDGVRIERLALGMDEDKGSKTACEIVYVPPTWYKPPSEPTEVDEPTKVA